MTELTKILIVANGQIEDSDWLSGECENADTVIAVDGGSMSLRQVDCIPDIYFGDSDSVTDLTKRWLVNNSVKMNLYGKDKDETDLELALLDTAIEGQSIRIAAGFGGRVDHELGNIFLLQHPDLVGADICLVSPTQQVRIVEGLWNWEGQAGDLVSVIPIEKSCLVKTTSGLKWPLENEILELGKPRGISNIMTESRAHIDIESGSVIWIHTSEAE